MLTDKGTLSLFIKYSFQMKKNSLKIDSVIRELFGWFQITDGTLVEGNLMPTESAVIFYTQNRPLPLFSRHSSYLSPYEEEKDEMLLISLCEPFCSIWYEGVIEGIDYEDGKKIGRYNVRILNRYILKKNNPFPLGTIFKDKVFPIWSKDLCYCSFPNSYDGYEIGDKVKIIIRDFNPTCSENIDLTKKANIIEKLG